MQSPKSWLRSTYGSIRSRKRLFVVFLIVLLAVAVCLLVFFNGSSLIAVRATGGGNGQTGGSTNGIGDDTGGGNLGLDPPNPAPEFSFGGGLLAAIICFFAFALFVKRDKLFKN